MNSIGRAWNPRAFAHARAGAILIVLAATIALWGCGNDNGTDPIEAPGPDVPPRSTPQELMDYFEEVYTEQDSALYGAMLDEEFTFYFLEGDADSLREILGPGNFWGRTLDLQSTGTLFNHPDVTGITLNIVINSTMPSAIEDCLECQQLETTITLRVATVGDGTEPLIYTVDSPQTFYVRADAADSTKWVIWQQIDRPSQGKAEPHAVESMSWGNVKGLYR